MTNEEEELEWSYGDDLNKWVECICCEHQYYIEYYELNAHCPICESEEYEESFTPARGI